MTEVPSGPPELPPAGAGPDESPRGGEERPEAGPSEEPEGGPPPVLGAVPAASEAEIAPEAPGAKRRIHPVIPFVAALLAIGAVLAALVIWKMTRGIGDTAPVVVEERREAPEGVSGMSPLGRKQYLRDGWKTDASETLAGFLAARTAEDRCKFVIGGRSRLADLKSFHEGIGDAGQDTPVEAFSFFPLDIADRERGLFLMRYERPAQWDLSEFFTPVAPPEVQKGLEEPGLLLAATAARENFAMEPVRVMAFFKEVGGRLLLDWDVFVQTKYRRLRHFHLFPRPGVGEVFRVTVQEDVPGARGEESGERRWFRFADPAYAGDYVKIPIDMASREGRILAGVAWIGIPGAMARTRYATVELGWTGDEEPELVLRRFLCWELLGLGGTEGNAVPTGLADPAPAGGDPGGGAGEDGRPPDSVPAREDEEPVETPPGVAGPETVQSSS